jgi:hypothetical protein
MALLLLLLVTMASLSTSSPLLFATSTTAATAKISSASASTVTAAAGADCTFPPSSSFETPLTVGTCPLSSTPTTSATMPHNTACTLACDTGYFLHGGTYVCIDGALRGVGGVCVKTDSIPVEESTWLSTCDSQMRKKSAMSGKKFAANAAICEAEGGALDNASGCDDDEHAPHKDAMMSASKCLTATTAPTMLATLPSWSVMSTPATAKLMAFLSAPPSTLATCPVSTGDAANTSNGFQLRQRKTARTRAESHVCMMHKIFSPMLPPTIGQHRPSWAKYGAFTYLPSQRFNHNLEHGGIVVAYTPCLPAASVCALRALLMAQPAQASDATPFRWSLTPYAQLPSTIAVLAYGHVYYADCLDTAAVTAFIAARRERGLESEIADGRFKEGFIGKSACAADDAGDGADTPAACDVDACAREHRQPCAVDANDAYDDDECRACLPGYVQRDDGSMNTNECVREDSRVVKVERVPSAAEKARAAREAEAERRERDEAIAKSDAHHHSTLLVVIVILGVVVAAGLLLWVAVRVGWITSTSSSSSSASVSLMSESAAAQKNSIVDLRAYDV